MRPGPRFCTLLLVSALFAVLASSASAAGLAKGHAKRVCGQVTGRVATCHAEVRTNADLQPLASATYQSGFAPADLQSAYNVADAALNNGGQETVGIVDAYDAPNLESDLAAYRQQFNLPVCGSGDGCFRKINQSGGTTPPTADASWAQETSLDVEMVSAICPNCQILVVEANSASYADLATAVDTAVANGATQVSNSYGGSEIYGSSYNSHYNHQGVDITVSSGDNGYGVEFPAASQYVTAVGGTHLVKDSSARGWTETVWNGAGSGCSGYFSKPSWQKDSGCSRRTVADQSAVADPNTGVAVYDSYPYQGASGWFVFGGTSVASPIIASIDALAGGRSPSTSYGSFPYYNPSLFNDVLSGSNGSCGSSYLCTAKAGYDGPTGIGTPNGAGAGSTTPPPASPDFTVSVSPSTQSVVRGRSTTYTVTVTPTGGFNGTVNLSATGGPNGTTRSFNPSSLTSGNSTLTVTTPSTGSWGTFTLTITGASGSLSHTASATLQIKRK